MEPLDYTFLMKSIQTPQCISPELLLNKICTFKSPLYSFGCVVYCLFHNGQFPLNETKIDRIRNIMLQKDYYIELREELEKIIELKTLFYGL